ncbi:hypothetical protein DE146DRAFT_759670 [Phaeosphaeria sp. MPI-PUGE-AT-0046c]|nr:hypothetical protein DE146DRAFT_759670 [Phaeosphaeria sp. MPI-PUGE-AT-0046c]
MSSTKPGPCPQWLYETQYDAAFKLSEEGYTDRCLAEAKCNLDDITLPPYYVIKNCILAASALGDWREADIYRLTAEQTYTTALHTATAKKDMLSLEALEGLQNELDQLEEFRPEDLATMIDGIQVYGVDDDDVEGDADIEDTGVSISEEEALEEQRAIAEAEKDMERTAAKSENEVEEAAGTVLTMRPATTEADPTTPAPTEPVPAIAVNPDESTKGSSAVD